MTNLKDNPVQIAADAAEAGIRGFSEQETTVGIARYAPFNARRCWWVPNAVVPVC